MLTIAGIVLPLLGAIIVGKHAKKTGKSSYLLIVFLALMQVCLVMIDMYTLKNPLD